MNASPPIEPPTIPKPRALACNKTKFLTDSQTAALEQLDHYAWVFRSANGRRFGGIAPRTKILLLGGTGSGKTAVTKRFAARHRWNFLSIDSSAWIPEGSSKPSTLLYIRNYVRSLNPDEIGVLMLDEADKLLPAGDGALQSNWSISLFGEALAAIDQDSRLLGHSWTKEDLEKYRSSVFLVAAGAFEFYLRKARENAKGGHLGFGPGDEKQHSFSEFLSNSQAIPDEISSRFAPPIFIQSPTENDFERVIDKIHQDLGFPPDRPVKALAAGAVASIGGLRWAENYVTRLLCEHPEVTKPAPGGQQETKAQSEHSALGKSANSFGDYDFFAPDTTHHVRLLNDDVFALHRVLSRMVSALAVAAAENRLPVAADDALAKYLNNPVAFAEHTAQGLSACTICSDVSPEIFGDAVLQDFIVRLWDGIRDFSPGLQKAGLLDLFQETFDLCGRVCQRRFHLSKSVARGRYRA